MGAAVLADIMRDQPEFWIRWAVGGLRCAGAGALLAALLGSCAPRPPASTQPSRLPCLLPLLLPQQGRLGGGPAPGTAKVRRPGLLTGVRPSLFLLYYTALGGVVYVKRCALHAKAERPVLCVLSSNVAHSIAREAVKNALDAMQMRGRMRGAMIRWDHAKRHGAVHQAAAAQARAATEHTKRGCCRQIGSVAVDGTKKRIRYAEGGQAVRIRRRGVIQNRCCAKSGTGKEELRLALAGGAGWGRHGLGGPAAARLAAHTHTMGATHGRAGRGGRWHGWYCTRRAHCARGGPKSGEGENQMVRKFVGSRCPRNECLGWFRGSKKGTPGTQGMPAAQLGAYSRLKALWLV